MTVEREVAIIGTRGIPAAHGGFETFAERLALYLKDRGWKVVVYCQGSESRSVEVDSWNGVTRVHIPVRSSGALSTIEFDWRCISHLLRTRPGVVLTLGYNTAVFCARLKLRGVRNVINMDGIEWKRAKWGRIAKLWFRINEWAGAWLGDHLVADHPGIAEHLNARHGVGHKISMIPYGADDVSVRDFDELERLGVEPHRFYSVIARPEPENSILEIVEGFAMAPRKHKLLVLGSYDGSNDYHRAVLRAANEDVIFAGAIYDKRMLAEIRAGSFAYVHGHTVGGTNPSLVEALGAGSPVLAHDNEFNRWVAGAAAVYFDSAEAAGQAFTRLEVGDALPAELGLLAKQFHSKRFRWVDILGEYESLLLAKLA